MSNIIYHQGDLFTAPEGSILFHACNTSGVWGAGIAVTFRERNPSSYESYQEYCEDEGPHGALGKCVVLTGDEDNVGCLMTSQLTQGIFDSPEQITKHTDMSLDFLRWQVKKFDELQGAEFHMPKINQGIFRVPWEDTESVLKNHSDMTFHVWEYSNEREDSR